MRDETKLRVMAEVALNEVVSELSVNDLSKIMSDFAEEDIVYAISMLPQVKKEKIISELKDNQ
nr:MAG TPA: MgtE intracellular N domain [Caudoviricetes sp.]